MGIAERTFTTVKAARDALLEAVRAASTTADPGKVFLQRGDATGDLTHIGPVVARHANRAVLVIDFAGSGTRGRDTATTYINAYRVPEARIGYVAFAGSLKDALAGCKPLKAGRVLFTDALGDATTEIADDIAVKGEARTAVKTTLRGGKFAAYDVLAANSFEALALTWLRTTKRIPMNRHCVVLWGRRSGERGGMYPLQDHNGAFMTALARKCLAAGWTVLAAGDFPRGEFGDVVADTWAEGNAKAVFLGEFWKDCPGVTDRQKQVRLYYVLWKMLLAQNPSHSLVHCGARSGGLDAYGFAGQPMIYVVGGSEPDARMQKKVVDRFASAADAGALLSYNFHNFRLANTPRRRIAGRNPPAWEDNAFTEGEVETLSTRIGILLGTTVAS